MALTDDAIDKIKAMIVAGELAPGSRLPKEEILAEQLGLSRSSLREAVRALAAMRILITRQGDGTYVSSLEPHLLLETLSFAADVSQGHAALQLLQVRRLLEPQATGLAAALLKPEDLRELRDILDRSRSVATVEEFVAHDTAFHLKIVEAVGNPVLSMLLQVVSTRTQRVRIVRGSRTRHALDHAHRDHEQILAALTSRDALLAASAATVHITAVEQWLAASLTDTSDEPPAPAPSGSSGSFGSSVPSGSFGSTGSSCSSGPAAVPEAVRSASSAVPAPPGPGGGPARAPGAAPGTGAQAARSVAGSHHGRTGITPTR
ncbi:DNA-binding FadR family transcriptional regulator [Streptomyces sp. B4I13]|nr:DNA-binding FadR family transcriptional regulator [Streptomyces sp. B4I13]